MLPIYIFHVIKDSIIKFDPLPPVPQLKKKKNKIHWGIWKIRGKKIKSEQDGSREGINFAWNDKSKTLNGEEHTEN